MTKGMLRVSFKNLPHTFLGILIFVVGTQAIVYDAFAQTAASIKEVVEDAIVAISVTGRDKTGEQVDKVGQGFVVYSEKLGSIIITARHVVGSNSPNDNEHWLVSDSKKIQRSVKVRFSNGDERDAEVRCSDILNGQLDAAVLMIRDYKANKIIELEGNEKKLEDEQPVFLAARDPATGQFPNILKQGRGLITKKNSPPLFATNVTSINGESGSPWVSLQNGRVLAIATAEDLSESKPSAVSTPIYEVWERCDLLREMLGPRKVNADGAQQTSGGKYPELIAAFKDIRPVLMMNSTVERNRVFFQTYWHEMDDFSAIGSAAIAAIVGVKNDDPRWLQLNAKDRDLARADNGTLSALMFDYKFIREIDLYEADISYIASYHRSYAYPDRYYNNDYLKRVLLAQWRVASSLKQDVDPIADLPESLLITDFVFNKSSKELKSAFLNARSINEDVVARAIRKIKRVCFLESVNPCNVNDLVTRTGIDLD